MWPPCFVFTAVLLTSLMVVFSQDGVTNGATPFLHGPTMAKTLLKTMEHVFVEKYGDFVSLHKPVVIEPAGATCTEGNITLRRHHLSRNYSGSDITYQCVSTCSRTYPVPHDTLYRAVPKGEIKYLGGSSCWPNEDDLRIAHGPQPERPNVGNDVTFDCFRLVDNRPLTQVRTYILDIFAESDGVILNVEHVFWLRAEQGYVYLEAGETRLGLPFPMNEWFKLAIQYNRSSTDPIAEMTLHVQRSWKSQRFALGHHPGVNGNGGPVYLGLGHFTSDLDKHFLQVSTCRETLGRATTQFSRSSQASRYVEIYANLANEIRGVCGNMTVSAHALLCALVFPDPGQQPCRTACDEIDRACQGFFSKNFFVCHNDSNECYTPDPESASDPVFQGKIYDMEIYDEMLTNREIFANLNYDDMPSLSPMPECLCPDNFPRALDGGIDLDLYCTRNVQHDNDDVKLARHVHSETERLFLSEYLTDGILENSEIYENPWQNFLPDGFRMWASAPGESTFSITVQLQETFAISRVVLHSMLRPTSGVYTLQSYEQDRWKDVQYFVTNIHQCPSSNMCTVISEQIEWDVPDFYINVPFSTLRTDMLRFQVEGDLASTEDFHLFTEFVVFGKEFCQCYYPGTVPGNRCDSWKRCNCIEELDMSKTSPRCEPYVYSVDPTHGPDIGGTPMSLYGKLLMPTTATPRVFLQNHGECIVIAGNNSFILCLLPPRMTEGLDSTIIVNNGDVNITTPFTFSYRPDPIIHSISPVSSILNGSIMQTITGRHLDSMHAPMLLIHVDYPTLYNMDDDLFSPICTLVNSTMMLCPAPSIPFRAPLQDIWNSPHDTGHPVSHDLINASVTFLCSSMCFPINAPFVIHYNPQFDDFPEPDRIRSFRIYYPHNHRHLEVKGRRLQTCCLDGDFNITVGGEPCEIYFRNATTIYCFPPSEEPSNDESIQRIIATVGSISTTVGYLDYVHLTESEDFKIGLSVFIVLLVVLCLLVYLIYRLAILLRKKWRNSVQRKISQQSNNLNRTDTMLLTLLPDKLQNRLEGLLIDFDQIEMDKELGKGNFGVVYKGVLKRDDKPTDVAVKTIKKFDIGFSDIEEFLQEATITRGFDHPNVLSITGVAIDKRNCYVVLPFMEKGNLRDLLLDVSQRFDVGDLVRLGHQAAKGMAYLEAHNFLHRDVAARNCMMDGDGTVKIADFGLSRDLYQGNYYQATTSRPLPVKWMAMECLVNDAVFTTKSDVWSFGVLLWEIITRGVSPYSHIDPRHQLYHLKQGGRLDKPEHCPDAFYDLMLSCWAENPKDRPAFKEIVKFITYLLESLDEDELEQEETTSKRPLRGDTCRLFTTKAKIPSRRATSLPTQSADARTNAPPRSDTARSSSSPINALSKEKKASDTAYGKGSLSTSYEPLSHVHEDKDMGGVGSSTGDTYTGLCTAPIYLEATEMPPDDHRQGDILGDDAPNLYVNENQDELQEVQERMSDEDSGLENPIPVGEQGLGMENTNLHYVNIPEYLVVVESPMVSSAYVNVEDSPSEANI